MASDNKKIELADFPTLAQYIRRIGAEQLNFRTFMIKEHVGRYYTQKVLIKLSAEGEIKCSAEGYDPTPEEARSIEHECRNMNFPRSRLANDSCLRDLKQKARGELFLFYKRDAGRDNIIMAQERVNREDGTKNYLPWTYYDDGEWRCMEPDGALPFYKPKDQKSALIMIHEGAKSAAAAQRIAESDNDHPWKQELAKYDHWGIIGGALAVHRADFTELKTENPVELVYVCDNDAPGMNSLAVVSKFYGKKMTGIYFDQRWPVSWDIADQMPESFFTESKDCESVKIYNGPMLNDLKIPATWATEEIDNPSGKKKLYRVTEHFAEEWLHSVTPCIFVYHDQPHRKYNEDEFNVLVRPFSDVKNTAELLVQQNRGKAITISYDPSKPCGMVQSGKSKERFRSLNTHVGGSVLPVKGDVTPFKEYVEYLFPVDSDRHEVLRWMATLVCCPEIKMEYGVLLISSRQGVGKTTIGEKILANLIGVHNVSKPTASDIVSGAFNSWLPNKRLAIVDEMYEGHSFKAYNKMKGFMTEEYIEVNEKYTKPYTVTNWCHMFATSNNEKALKIDDQDRRWFIPKVTEKSKKPEWWVKFYEWLYKENGFGIIMWWLKEQIKNGELKPVNKSEKAPTSDMKLEIIGASMSESTMIIRDVLTRIFNILEDADDPMTEGVREAKEKYGNNIIVRVNDIRDFINSEVAQSIKNVDYRLKIEPREIRKIAKDIGFFLSKKRLNVRRTLDSFIIGTDDGIEAAESWKDMIQNSSVIVFGAKKNDKDEQQVVLKGQF